MSISQPICLQGACTLGNVRDHHATLVEALRNPGPLTLDLSAVEQADISFVQLLVSAARTAAARGATYRLAAISEPLAAAFARAGLGFEPATGQLSHI